MIHHVAEVAGACIIPAITIHAFQPAFHVKHDPEMVLLLLCGKQDI